MQNCGYDPNRSMEACLDMVLVKGIPATRQQAAVVRLYFDALAQGHSAPVAKRIVATRRGMTLDQVKGRIRRYMQSVGVVSAKAERPSPYQFPRHVKLAQLSACGNF